MRLFTGIGGFFSKLVFVGMLVLAYMYFSLPNVGSLKHVSYQEPLEILTKDGELIESFGKVHRIPVKIEEVPYFQIQALLVTEDQRFYEHPGIDIIGIGRAFKELVSTGEKRQGASTITMQVARNFFLGREKTYFRKINEVLLALAIERSISKDEILELYLNKIYFGHRAYGIAAAARTYFGKTLESMTIAEMAMLAGLPKSPSRNNPFDNIDYAVARRNLILQKMLEKSVISQETYEISSQEPVILKRGGTISPLTESGRYIADLARQTIVSMHGNKAYAQGLKVYTTIDGKRQIAATEAVQKGLELYDKKEGWQSGKRKNLWQIYEQPEAWRRAMRQQKAAMDMQTAMFVDTLGQQLLVDTLNTNKCDLVDTSQSCWLTPDWCAEAENKVPAVELGLVRGDVIYLENKQGHLALTQVPKAQGALVALQPTGEIEALVGGYLFKHSHFNRAAQAYRQPGSAIKPLLYALALEKGYTMATKVNDAPIVVEDIHGENALWRPKNVDNVFKGPMRLRQALIQSRNLVSVRLASDLGVEQVLDRYEQFGLDRSRQPQGLSISLGAGLVTPLQLAHAFTVFPNRGRLEPVKWILRVEDSHGNMLWDGEAVRAYEQKLLPLETGTAKEVTSPETAYIIASGLRDVVRYGTGRGANVLKRDDIYGKTGTSNDQQDAWFSGFAPDLVTTVWVGHDESQKKNLKGMGSKVALPIWVDFMRSALGKQQKQIEEPDDIVRLRINRETGFPVAGDLSNSMFELFSKDNLPDSPKVAKTAQSEEEQSLRDELF